MANHGESFNRIIITGKAPAGTKAGGAAAGGESLGFVERRRVPRPLPAPEVIEKNSDSIWAEFESVVPYNKANQSAPAPKPKSTDKPEPLWLDTIVDNGLADTNFDKDL